MYILIFEDGTFKKAKDVSEDDILDAVDGLLDIIDISNPDSPKYFDGVEYWRDLESAD